MANFFTNLLGLTKQVTGENPDGLWGTTLNEGFMDLVDAAMAGRSDISVTAADVILSTDDGTPNQARAMFLIATGIPTVSRNIVVPSTQKLYLVMNESDSIVTIKTAAGVGVPVAVGAEVALFVDSALDEVFQIQSVGTSFPDGGIFEVTTGTIENATAGDTAPSLFLATQGNLVSAVLPISNIVTVTVNAITYRWFPDTDPFTPSPSLDHTKRLTILEDATYHDCYCTILADGSEIEFFKCDGASWIATSVRSLPNPAFLIATTYPRV